MKKEIEKEIEKESDIKRRRKSWREEREIDRLVHIFREN